MSEQMELEGTETIPEKRNLFSIFIRIWNHVALSGGQSYERYSKDELRWRKQNMRPYIGEKYIRWNRIVLAMQYPDRCNTPIIEDVFEGLVKMDIMIPRRGLRGTGYLVYVPGSPYSDRDGCICLGKGFVGTLLFKSAKTARVYAWHYNQLNKRKAAIEEITEKHIEVATDTEPEDEDWTDEKTQKDLGIII